MQALSVATTLNYMNKIYLTVRRPHHIPAPPPTVAAKVASRKAAAGVSDASPTLATTTNGLGEKKVG